jgi:hypothetical protein
MSADLHRQALRVRRDRLVARSVELRARLQADVVTVQQPLRWVDQARSGWQQGAQWLRGHPQWVAGGVLVLVALRPRGLLRWGGRLYAGWQLVQRTRPLWAPLLGRRRPL